MLYKLIATRILHLLPCVKCLLIGFTACMFCLCSANAQMFNREASPIWGPNNMEIIIGQPLHNDPSWGVPPSQQTAGTSTNMNPVRRRRFFDSNGNPLLTDVQGNVIFNIYGEPLIDSVALNNQSSSGTMSSDNLGIPDDPVDVPIDGGLVILLMIGLGAGYRGRHKAEGLRLKAVAGGF